MEELTISIADPTNDGVGHYILIDYRPDVTGNIIVRWGNKPEPVTVPADAILVGDARVYDYLPQRVALRVVAAMGRMRQRWEDNLVLSRPIDNPAPVVSENGSPAFLMGIDLARSRIPMPLGWIENVGIRVHSPPTFSNGLRRYVHIDIGAPPGRNEGKVDEREYLDVGRVGRLGIPLKHAHDFAQAIASCASTGEIRTFNMDGKIHAE